MNGVEISRVKSVFIDDELKFDVHIQHFYSKLIKFVCMFYKLAQRLPNYCLNKMLSYRRETALQGTLVLAESGRLELRDNILLIL